MKKFILSITLCVSFVGVAQNLENKIPSNVQAVVSVNGDRLQELMSVAEFDELDMIKKLFKEVKNDSATTITSLKDYGFDISSKAYYFYQTTDSISYHQFIIKLSDKSLYENLLSKSKKEKIEKEGDIKNMTDLSGITIWNDNTLLFTGHEVSNQYFSNTENYKRHAKDEDESLYEIKKRVGKRWAKAHALEILNNNNSNSIINNRSYTKRKDNKAVASYWVNNYGELINNTMKFGLASMFLNPNMDARKFGYGIDSMWGNIYLDNNEARITADMEINDGWIKTYKNIYKSKIDQEFFNYFNQNNVLAYSSISFNMQGMLEEYPTIIANIYGGIKPQYQEESDASAETISVLLDEEAIGEFVTGNMFFVLNDITEKEVTYTTYEYDDDYNRTEVTNTKTEPMPNFTIMIGSKNKKLVNKLVRLAAKHQLVNPKANYFKLKKNSDIPFDMYFAFKNEIAFFTSSEKQILDILKDNINSNTGSHKKMIRNNISTFYVNGKQLMHKIPDVSFSKKEREVLNYAKENLTEAYFTTSRLKGNKIHSEFKMDTPLKHGNSLKFFLNFLEMAVK